jgi:glucosamine 6-phosphate synthetase-like amidotransferase/phosphosugar isomerase protein
VIGFKDDDFYLSSDSNAIANVTDYYIPIDDHEMVIIDKNTYKIISAEKEVKKDKIESIAYNTNSDM